MTLPNAGGPRKEWAFCKRSRWRLRPPEIWIPRLLWSCVACANPPAGFWDKRGFRDPIKLVLNAAQPGSLLLPVWKNFGAVRRTRGFRQELVCREGFGLANKHPGGEIGR